MVCVTIARSTAASDSAGRAVRRTSACAPYTVGCSRLYPTAAPQNSATVSTPSTAAAQHIDQLRELVEAGRAQEPAERRDPAVAAQFVQSGTGVPRILARQHAVHVAAVDRVVAVDVHAAELQHDERPLPVPDPGLPE